EELWLADGDQGRGHGGQGGRARDQVREHGRTDGARGGEQDQRRGGRRHHDRDGAGAGHLPRGVEARGRGHEPDGAEARRREGGGGDRRGAGQDEETHARLRGDRAGGHDLGQQRRDDRAHPGRGHAEGGQGGRDHGRGGQVDGHRPRGGRGHAVRPRLPLALLRDGPRAHGGGARGAFDPLEREEGLFDEGPPPGARAGGAPGQAAADRGGGGGGRSPRHAGGEQDPGDAGGGGGEGAGLRRPEKVHAAGHGDPDRGPGDQRGVRVQL